ncbi:uncharacterized protein [Drosophila takahashii]|uniref:uncharacterized protein n=1 Tax=Drosophila takahashii TaxID=29030 RepID=UPI003899604C
MDLNKVSIKQLKIWLSVLKCSTTGSKQELILRLNKLPSEKRNKFNEMKENRDGEKSKGEDGGKEKFQERDGDRSNCKDGGNEKFQERDGDRSNCKDGGIENFEEEDGGKSNNEDGGKEDYEEEEGDEINSEDGEGKNKVGEKNDKGEDGEKVREYISEDGENESEAGEDTRGERSYKRDGEQNKGGGRNRNCAEVNMQNQAGEKEKMENNFNQSIDISLRMATQVLCEFAGESCARKWITRIYNIASIYGITGNYIKMLMISKIKGKANVWLHANAGRVLLPLEELTAELIAMFGEKSSKLEIRRKFEHRKWSAGETFGSYVNDKIMLAQGINIDGDEMLSCIIEGITNQGLRNLAHIQSFVDVGHIKRAFADVRLPKYVGKPMTSLDFKDKKETRCFNCNAKGHWANECRKSKREKGSCYACGEMGHFVATCLKSKNKNTGNNNYNVS